jgi:hypothetical protein
MDEQVVMVNKQELASRGKQIYPAYGVLAGEGGQNVGTSRDL